MPRISAHPSPAAGAGIHGIQPSVCCASLRARSLRRRHLQRMIPSATLTPFSVGRLAQLSLDDVRGRLVKEEDALVFHLATRRGHRRNAAIYTNDPPLAPKGFTSLLGFALRETDTLNRALQPYNHALYHPFFPNDQSEHPRPSAEVPVGAETVNLNSKILDYYLQDFLPGWVEDGDDTEYAACVLADVQCLLCLSRRIHLGTYVAEAKFREQPEKYAELIERGDREAILNELTFVKVEECIIDRVRSKAHRHPALHGREDEVGNLYRDWVIPLTKEVEVQVLMKRLSHGSHHTS